MIVLPMGEWIMVAKKLEFEVTNNILECNTYVYSLETLIAMRIRRAKVLGDSKLAIS